MNSKLKSPIESIDIDAFVKNAVAEEIETHRRMGRSIVVWREGKVVTIPPEQIEPRPLPGDETASDKAAG